MDTKTSFIVNDMTCNHCAGTIRSALEEAIPGSVIEIDVAAHRVRFTGDAKTGEKAIREAGYTPEANS